MTVKVLMVAINNINDTGKSKWGDCQGRDAGAWCYRPSWPATQEAS